jgi:hypothetical protein
MGNVKGVSQGCFPGLSGTVSPSLQLLREQKRRGEEMRSKSVEHGMLMLMLVHL